MRLQERLPATLSQASLFFAQAQCSQASAYNMAMSVSVNGEIPTARLIAACHELYRATPALRMRLGIDPASGVITAWLHDTLPAVAVREDDDPASVIDEATREELDVDEGPLARFLVMRVGRRSAVLAVVFHHLVADGMCHQSLADRMARSIVSELSPDPGASYLARIRSVGKQEFEARDVDRGYWQERLGVDFLSGVSLPLRSGSSEVLGARTVITVSPADTQWLRGQARAAGVSLFKFLIAAIHHNLPSGPQGTTVVCTAASQRPPGDDGTMVGCFINEVPLMARHAAGQPVVDVARRESGGWQSDLRRRHFPFTDLAALADPAGTSPVRLDSVMVGYRRAPRYLRWSFGQLQCTAELSQPFPTAKTELSVRFLDRGDSMECEVQWGRRLADLAGPAFATRLKAALGEPS